MPGEQKVAATKGQFVFPMIKKFHWAWIGKETNGMFQRVQSSE